MRTALLLLLFFCLVEADDIRYEFQQFKSQLEAQFADMAREIAQLKGEVKNLKAQCPSGWLKFEGSCYYMSTGEKTWQQSTEFCQNQGADLVAITSREEQDFVNRLAGRDKNVWFGLTDREREGVFKWVDGTPLTQPTYWGSTEPDDRDPGEDCCAFSYGVWRDWPCGASHYWMCERSA